MNDIIRHLVVEDLRNSQLQGESRLRESARPGALGAIFAWIWRIMSPPFADPELLEVPYRRNTHDEIFAVGDITVLLLFGNPKVGTPLMHCSPTVAIDLPQKRLIREDKGGVTRVGYNAPVWLDARHGLGDCAKVLDKGETALSSIMAAATE